MREAAQRADQAIYLARGGNANRVGDAQAVYDPQLVYGQVDAPQVGLGAAEGILCAETQHDVRRLRPNPRQHFRGQLDNLVDALAVAEAAQGGRSADDHVEPTY